MRHLKNRLTGFANQQMALRSFFNIIATMGWTNIISQIILLKDKLTYPFSRIALSTKVFPLNYQLPITIGMPQQTIQDTNIHRYILM